MKNEEKIEILKKVSWKVTVAFMVLMEATKQKRLPEEKFLEALTIGDITIDELTKIIHSL